MKERDMPETLECREMLKQIGGQQIIVDHVDDVRNAAITACNPLIDRIAALERHRERHASLFMALQDDITDMLARTRALELEVHRLKTKEEAC
jgi:hypothetical protein